MNARSFAETSRWARTSQGEMETRAGHVWDDQRVARAAEEDPDERHDQAEAAEHREQHHGGLALGWSDREQVSAVDIRDQGRTDQDESWHEDAGDRRVEVGQQLL